MANLQKTERHLPSTLQQLSKSAFVQTLQQGNFKAVSDLLPSKIHAAINEPPICDLIKVAGNSIVVRYVEFELIRMSSLISVGNNLNNAQVEFIATQLVEMFPNESLADFKLCFQRGSIGQYGEIFRMDGIVLRKWMEKYLDEKYTVVEEELRKAKDNPHKLPEKAEEGPGYKAFKEYAKSLTMGMKNPGMTDADYRKYGKEKPAKRDAATAGHKYFQVRNIQVFAGSQEHAEELVALMIQRGDLIEDNGTET